MEDKTLQSHSEQDTDALAREIAPLLQAGDIVFLKGNLGTGKTVFCRALIRALAGNPDMDIPSPTYTLVQTYDTQQAPLWHFDLYRIKSPDDIYELGWEEALYDGISLIEWPEKLENLAPPNRLDIVFTHSEQDSEDRVISFIPQGDWKKRAGQLEDL